MSNKLEKLNNNVEKAFEVAARVMDRKIDEEIIHFADYIGTNYEPIIDMNHCVVWKEYHVKDADLLTTREVYEKVQESIAEHIKSTLREKLD